MSLNTLSDFHNLTTTIGCCLVAGAATTSAYALSLPQERRPLLFKISAGVATLGCALGITGDMLADPNTSPRDAEVYEIVKCPLTQLQQLLSQAGEDSFFYRFFEVLEKTQGVGCHNFLPFNNTFHEQEYTDIHVPSEIFHQEPVLWSLTPQMSPLTMIHYICQTGSDTASTLFHVTKDFATTSSSGNSSCFPLRAFVSIENLEQFKELFRTGTTSFIPDDPYQNESLEGFRSITERIVLTPLSLVHRTSLLFHNFFSSWGKGL